MILGVDCCSKFKLSLNFHTHSWDSEVCAVSSAAGLRSSHHFTASQALSLKEIISEYEEYGKSPLGCTSLTEHAIDSGDVRTIKQRLYPLSPARQALLEEKLDKMLKLGVIQPSKRPWSSPVLIVRKSSGETRYCFDGGAPNAVTKKDAYPLPFISSILDQLRDGKYLSSSDLKSAFWQVPLETVSEISALEKFTNIQDPWYLDLRTRVLAEPQEYPLTRIENNLLYQLMPNAYNLLGNLSLWKLIVTREFRKQIVSRCHDDVAAAQFGGFKTFKRVGETYYWPRMRAYILSYVAYCPKYLEHKAQTPGPLG